MIIEKKLILTGNYFTLYNYENSKERSILDLKNAFFFSILKTLWQAQSKNVLGHLDSNCWKRNLYKNRQFFSGNGQVLQGPILWFVAAINNGFETFVESHSKVYNCLISRFVFGSCHFRNFVFLYFGHFSCVILFIF